MLEKARCGEMERSGDGGRDCHTGVDELGAEKLVTG